MNNELSQRMEELKKEMADLEQQMQGEQRMQEQRMQEQRIQEQRIQEQRIQEQRRAQEQGLASEQLKVLEHIRHLQSISRDPDYNQFLNQMHRDLEHKVVSPQRVSAELDRSYAVYRKRMYHNQPYSPPPGQLPSHPGPLPVSPEDKDRSNSAIEFFVGAGVLSIIGALFLVVAFIAFGLNVLEGMAQGMIIYAVPAITVLLSELILKRKLPRLAAAITGAGIAAIYVSNIINYRYLEIISSLSAVLITLAVVILSMLLGRKKRSAFRLVCIAGCYLSFLLVGSMYTDMGFLVSVGTFFLINVAVLFLPGNRESKSAGLFHMGLNILFTVIFAAGAAAGGVAVVYIIFGITLSLVLLNIYFHIQEKDTLQVVFYIIELVILGLVTLLSVSSATASQLISVNLYTRLIAVILTLAAGFFFYLFSRDQRMKLAVQYYTLMTSLMIIMNHAVGAESFYALLLFFVIGRLFLRRKELEVYNCIVTVAAFSYGLSEADRPQSWLYFGAFLISVLFIRRWHLFYRYTATLFLLIFASLALPSYNLSNPACAAILGGLIPAVHFITAAKDKRASMQSKPSGHYTESNVLIGQIYTISCLGVLGIVSLYSIYCRNVLAVVVTSLIGAASVLLYLTPRFHLNFKRKYLIIAGYLTFMSFIIRVNIPVFVSVFLAALAMFCIYAGFKAKDKALRIYGLVLALYVGVKVTAYDFRESGSLQRIILFLVIGVIMLIISLIYIKLEKRSGRKKVDGQNNDDENERNVEYNWREESGGGEADEK